MPRSQPPRTVWSAFTQHKCLFPLGTDWWMLSVEPWVIVGSKCINYDIPETEVGPTTPYMSSCMTWRTLSIEMLQPTASLSLVSASHRSLILEEARAYWEAWFGLLCAPSFVWLWLILTLTLDDAWHIFLGHLGLRKYGRVLRLTTFYSVVWNVLSFEQCHVCSTTAAVPMLEV